MLTFTDFNKKKKARFAKHDVIGQKPVMEFIGSDIDTIGMKIRLDAQLGILPSVGLSALGRMIDSGQPYLLLVGNEYHGQFVIESLEEDHRHITGKGITRIADVTLELKEAQSGGIRGLLSLFA